MENPWANACSSGHHVVYSPNALGAFGWHAYVTSATKSGANGQLTLCTACLPSLHRTIPCCTAQYSPARCIT